MKIEVLTEGQYIGKVQRDHPHMRTDLAWICALQADHIPIVKVHEIENEYDLGVFILPKKLEQIAGYLEQVDYKSKFKKIAFMQEGPQTFFQDYHINLQFWYYDFLQNVDYIFTHNLIDQNYYRGLTNKPTYILQSLIIETPLQNLEIKTYDQRKNLAIIGGNFTEWYSGFDSYIVAREFSENVAAPSMGRSQHGEEQVVQKVPHIQWKDWMSHLNSFRYGVHMMRTAAAGTFSLNCAYLGIPCIGYDIIDTQSILHPDLTVQVGDIGRARQLACRLRDDRGFYDHVSHQAQERYRRFYTEEIFLKKFYEAVF